MKNRIVAVSTGATIVVALGASGAWAVGQITSADIRNQTIQRVDISEGGVGGSEVLDGALGLRDLNDYTQDKINQNAKDGTDGTNGTDGEDGANGTNGQNGQAGKDAAYAGPHWSIIDRSVIGNGDAYLRSGPFANTFGRSEEPPMGVGSLGLRTGSSTDKVVFGNEVDFEDDLVSALSAVSYWVFSSGAKTSPNVQFEIDPEVNNPEGNPINYTTMTFVPEDVVAGTWAFVDASTAKRWYLTGSAGAATGCNDATYCTLAEIKERAPNAKIITAQINKGRDSAFSGAVDNLRINDTLYDFEPFGVYSSSN